MDFLQKNGIFPYEEEVIYILRRLDKDDDGRISLLELLNEVSPKESLGFIGGPSMKTNLSLYENALGKNLKSSASKNYPFEAIRRSASPMKGQTLKSPIKETMGGGGPSGSKVRSHRKEYSNTNNQIESQINREYSSQYVRQEVNNILKEKETTTIYESPKKRLEFESVTSFKHNNNSPSLYPRKEPTPSLNNLKSELEREMGYSKKSFEYKDLKSEVERELNNSKYRSTPPKNTVEKDAFSSNNYQSLSGKKTITEGVLLEIAQFLKLLIRSEREVQYLRGDLSLRPDYNISELFNSLDKLNKGYLNPEEIEEFFEAFDVFSSQEKNAFLSRFCKTKEILKYFIVFFHFFRFFEGFFMFFWVIYLIFYWSFADFVNAFQGNQETVIENSKVKRQSIRKGVRDVFSIETFSIIKEIVRNLVKNERIIEENSKELLRKNPVDLKEVFAMVDVNKNGVLSEFEVFLLFFFNFY